MNSNYDYEEEYKENRIVGVKNGKHRTHSSGVTVFIYNNKDLNSEKHGCKKGGIVFFITGLLSDQSIERVGKNKFYNILWKISFDFVKQHIDLNLLENLQSQSPIEIPSNTIERYLKENEK